MGRIDGDPSADDDQAITDTKNDLGHGLLDRVYWGTGGGIDGDLANYSAVSSPINFWYIQNKNPDFFPSRTADGWVVGTASAPVPEIDPATGSSALSLVAGLLAMVEQRRRRGLKAGLAG